MPQNGHLIYEMHLKISDSDKGGTYGYRRYNKTG